MENDPEGISYTKNCQKKHASCSILKKCYLPPKEILTLRRVEKQCRGCRWLAVCGLRYVCFSSKSWSPSQTSCTQVWLMEKKNPSWHPYSIHPNACNSTCPLSINAIGSVSINSFDHIIRWRYHRRTFNSVAKVVKLSSVDSATLVI